MPPRISKKVLPEIIEAEWIEQITSVDGEAIIKLSLNALARVLNDIDITKITPLEAMNLLYGLTDIVKKEKNNEQN